MYDYLLMISIKKGSFGQTRNIKNNRFDTSHHQSIMHFSDPVFQLRLSKILYFWDLTVHTNLKQFVNLILLHDNFLMNEDRYINLKENYQQQNFSSESL